MPMLRPMKYTGTVGQRQAATFLLLLRYFGPLATPDAFDTLVVDVPASLPVNAVMQRYPFRPYSLARSTMARLNASSSSRAMRMRLCVDLGCPKTRRALRSETLSFYCT